MSRMGKGIRSTYVNLPTYVPTYLRTDVYLRIDPRTAYDVQRTCVSTGG